jgi:hypothetical protein
MSESRLSRVRAEQGQVHGALVAVAAVALGISLLPQGAHAAVSVAATKALVQQVESAADAIAYSHDGSFARVGVINLRKVGLVNDVASSGSPYVSSASGTAHTYRVVVRSGPHRYSLVRGSTGTLTFS